jgi:Fe-S cluster assembly protein SufD
MELAARLVFVNGHLCAELSETNELPAGVTVCTMGEAIARHPELVRAHLGRLAPIDEDPFTALNMAAMGDGLFVHVPAGERVELPIGVRHLSVDGRGGEPVLKCPRSLVIVEEGGEATIAERFSARGDETYLTNAMTEIVVGAGARVAHYAINRESRRAFHVSSRNIEIGAGAHFESHAVILGGATTRNNVTPRFIGADADGILNGVYLAGAGQHVDNSMRVYHDAEHCRSRQFYKGLLTDDGRGVFTGRIVVAKRAQKTDAIQSNANLLLSKDARANSRPQLEIYADDVRCTHGATVGELDEDAMFYLRARGLPENAARAILVAAFARENIERMGLEPIRDWLIKRVLERLPDTELLLPAD